MSWAGPWIGGNITAPIRSLRRHVVSKRMFVPIALVAAFGLAVPVLAQEDGKKLYESKCGICHGNDGVAKKMAAGSKNFNDAAWKKTATVESIVKDTKDGKGKMKGMGDKLTPEQMTAIANYVLTMAK
jgi:mono/diheme cytochrome c family protein